MKIGNKIARQTLPNIVFPNEVINNLPTYPGFSQEKKNFLGEYEFKYSIFDTGKTPIKNLKQKKWQRKKLQKKP